jgi:transcriptional regulator with XRE-family HTH domain
MALPLHVKIGRTIARLRNDAKLSQEKLAALARVHRTYIGKVERGEQDPNTWHLEKIAKALKLPVSELIREAEKG